MTGAERIAAERQRQIEVEGWDAEHDRGHAEDGSGSEALVWAAICYATPPSDRRTSPMPFFGDSGVPREWPWDSKWWKPGERIRELEKAGALIAAEIDRLVERELTE
jgi:hypothetical protein